jgi:polysaccharide export outer membrane protein
LSIYHMVHTNMSKTINQPIAGLTLLAMIMAFPCPTKAQTPVPERPIGERLIAPNAPINRQAPAANQGNPASSPVPAPSNLPANSPAATPAAAQPVVAPADYALGGGDRIRINVFEVPEYTGDYQIPPGGELYLPLVGGVRVLGLTQSQAADAIAAKYSRYLKRPLVTVSLLSPRPINVVIAGEVNRPGSYTVGLEGGAGDNPGVQYPTIVGALTLAEGLTLSADLRQVKLRRKAGLGPEQTINLDLTELVRTGKLPQDITLRDGDTVFVPTTNEPNMAEIRQFATASFAAAPNRPRTVTIVGEVNRPGSYVVVGGSSSAAAPSSSANSQGGRAGTIEAGGNAGGGLPTVSRAIQLAGGITATADVRNIQIRRTTKTGSEQKMNLNFWKLLQGDPNQDTIVQEGDTIIIPTSTDINPAEATALADASFSPATIQVSVVGEVKNPGAVSLQPNTPMNQAILTAGGFNDSRARKSSVELVRLNPDGTVTKQRLPIDLAQGINNKNNPILRNNDIVVVGRSGTARVGDTIGTLFGPIVSPFLGILNIFR